MSEPLPFHVFHSSHLAVLGGCAVLLVILAYLRRARPDWAVHTERALGVILLLLWPVTTWVHWQKGTLDLNNALPFHLCDVAGIAGGIALWTHRQLACEIVYFFGLAGTLQGLITPNLAVDFPDPRFAVFFLLHGGVVVTAVHVVTAMKRPPLPWAVPRMIGVTFAYAGIVGIINFCINTNYGFLCRKPEQASLMDLMPAWPWYIGCLVILCGVFYSLLYLPFGLGRRLRARRQ